MLTMISHFSSCIKKPWCGEKNNSAHEAKAHAIVPQSHQSIRSRCSTCPQTICNELTLLCARTLFAFVHRFSCNLFYCILLCCILLWFSMSTCLLSSLCGTTQKLLLLMTQVDQAVASFQMLGLSERKREIVEV